MSVFVGLLFFQAARRADAAVLRADEDEPEHEQAHYEPIPELRHAKRGRDQQDDEDAQTGRVYPPRREVLPSFAHMSIIGLRTRYRKGT
jgi:hypothetical protein